MFKKRKIKGFSLAAMMLGATLITTGCGGAEAGDNNVLVVAQNADAISLDPQASNDMNSALIINQVFDTLVNQDENMEIKPGLATDWRQIDDYTWEFDLRDDVYFHNGEKFTAADVKFTFTRGADAAVISPIVGEINPESIEIIDDYTVRIGTHEPFAPFLSHVAHTAASIINEKAVEEHGADFGQNPVGTGAFVFEDWAIGDRIELLRNDDYHGELPQFEELIVRSITEPSSRTIELETGQVDIALGIASADVERVANHDDLILIREQNLQTSFIYLNMEQEPFNIKEVRQAINYALNIDEIINAVFEGVGSTAPGPLPSTVWGVNPDLEAYPVDVERARELLAEAGLEDGFSTELLVTNSTTNINMATVIRNQLGEVGIDVDIQSLEWGTFVEAVDAGEHYMASMGWTTVTGDADYGLFPMFHTSQWGSAGNRSYFSNERVDELLEMARATTDDEARLEAYFEAQEIIVEEAPKVWVSHGELVVGTQNNVGGLIIHPTGTYDFSTVYFVE